MSVGTLPAPVGPLTMSQPAPGRAVTWLAVRQIRRSALIVAGLAAGMTALVATPTRR